MPTDLAVSRSRAAFYFEFMFMTGDEVQLSDDWSTHNQSMNIKICTCTFMLMEQNN